MLSRSLWRKELWLAGCVFSLQLASAWQFPSERILELITEPYLPQPSSKIHEAWMQDIFEIDEFWLFKRQADYEQILGENVADPTLRETLRQLDRGYVPQKYKAALMAHCDDYDRVIFIPASVRARVPPDLARAVYWYEEENYPSKCRLHLDQPNQVLAAQYLDLNFDRMLSAYLKENMIAAKEKVLVPLTPHIWKRLPMDLRAQLIKKYLSPTPAKRALIVRKIFSAWLCQRSNYNLKALQERSNSPRSMNRS